MTGTNVKEHPNEVCDSMATSPLTSPVSTTYDWTNVEPTTAVVETTAAATDTRPIDLDVLHDVVDTSALNTFLTDDQTDESEDRRVSFDYHGCTVIARQDGRITVHPVDG